MMARIICLLVAVARAACEDESAVLPSLRRIDDIVVNLTKTLPVLQYDVPPPQSGGTCIGSTEECRAKGAREPRVVLSWGGAADGGIVSEGQGYGLMTLGLTAAALPRGHHQRRSVMEVGYSLFLGWRLMAERTGQSQGGAGRTADKTCIQDPTPTSEFACGGEFGATPPSAPPDYSPPGSPPAASGWNAPPPPPPPPPGPPGPRPPPATKHRCLPSWKWTDDLFEQIDFGTAVDADQDAILGMIMLVLAAMDEPSSPPWTLYLSMIAYQSCRAFLEYDTIEGNVRQFRAPPNQQYRLRVPKLGSCFGGFTCSSPSYLAPAHYKLFRDFSARFAPLIDPVNGETRAAADRLKWDALIEGSQQILSESQCANGLVPNWWVPSQGANLYAHEKTATGAVAGEARGPIPTYCRENANW